MPRTAQIVLALVLPFTTVLTSAAWAQTSEVLPERPAGGGGSADNISEEPTSEARSFLEGAGWKVGDGMVFHPHAALETGYQPNVFYSNSSQGEEVLGAPLMRLSVGGALSTLSPQRMEAEPASQGQPVGPKLSLRGNADLAWHQYLSGNTYVSHQNNLGVGMLLDARLNPQGTFTFVGRDSYSRFVRPPAGLTVENTARDRNELTLGGVFKPGGGAIQGYANYTFVLDVFEQSALSFGNRLGHTFSLGGRWQWLPMTQVSGEASFGFMSPSSTEIKSSSMPLRVWLGLSSLITPTFGVILRAGYGNGFYGTGANYNSYVALAEARLSLPPSLRAAVGYSHDFSDSVLANFYTDHSFYGRLNMQLGQRFIGGAKAAFKLRSYEYGGLVSQGGYTFCGDAGCATSDHGELIFEADLSLDYQANEWLVVGANYLLNVDASDFRIEGGAAGPDYAGYTWQEVMVKATAKF